MQMEEWDAFDVNRVTQLTQGRPLEAVALEVLHRFNLLQKLRLPKQKLRSFLRVSSPPLHWAWGNAAWTDETGAQANSMGCDSSAMAQLPRISGSPCSICSHYTGVLYLAWGPAEARTDWPCPLQEVEATYRRSNPYHNSTHAADVVQGLACMFAQNSFMAQLTDLEMLSMILACVMHDAGHPGVPCKPDHP